MPTGPPRTSAATRFLALGDSYTIGEGVEPAGRWPVQLVARLRQRGVGVANPRIVARTGWTCGELAAALERAALEPCYRLVALSIGVNDQYRGYPVGDYRARFQALLERAASLAGGAPDRVLVVSIPDWSVTPFAASDRRGRARIAAELADYNAVMRELSLAAGAAHADITPSTRAMGTEPVLVTEDGLHPSATLYASWADQLADPVQAMLAADPRPGVAAR